MFEDERDRIATRYQTEIEMLTPLHIASGHGTLFRDTPDFLQRGDRIAVLDPTRLGDGLSPQQIDRLANGASLTAMLRELPAGVLDRITHYRLTSPFGEVQKFQPAIKLADGRPYVPGSSLKGALRTVLAWAMMRAGETELDVATMPAHDPRAAADRMEADLFGPEETREFPQSLRVSDTGGADESALARVRVYSVKREGLRPKHFVIDVESLPAGEILYGTLRIDDWQLKQRSRRGDPGDRQSEAFIFGRGGHYLGRLMRLANIMALNLINAEIEFYSTHGMFELVDVYRRLKGTLGQLDGDRECLLQLGWGVGWHAHTVGLTLDEETFQAVRDKYDLGTPGAEFPKTRKLADPGAGEMAPLGWLRLSLHEPGSIEVPESHAQAVGTTGPMLLSELVVGRQYRGTVRNVVGYGAFVDIGATTEGLVHVSQMAPGGVDDPTDVVRAGQEITVWVTEVDHEKQQFALTMLPPEE